MRHENCYYGKPFPKSARQHFVNGHGPFCCAEKAQEEIGGRYVGIARRIADYLNVVDPCGVEEVVEE